MSSATRSGGERALQVTANEAQDPAGIMWAVTAAYVIGVLGGNMQPLLIGALIDGLHMDAGSAGLLGSIELAAVATCSFTLAPRMGTIPRRALLLFGAALAVLGYVASALPQSFGGLAVCRLVAGVGAGMVLAIGNAAVSSCRQPERVFARMTIIGTIVMTMVLAVLPMAIVRFAYRGGYVGMGVLALVVAPLLRWIPASAPRGRQRGTFEASNGALGCATLGATALLFFCQSAIWAFSERIAVAAHMTDHHIGVVLAASTLVGLGGAGLAQSVGTRMGRTLPLTGGVLATGLTLFALVYADTPARYTAILLLNGVAYLFMVPYLLGTAAALDPQGRWAAATIGAATIGAAVGPGIAGPIVGAGGYTAIGWLVLLASTLSAGAITAVGRTLDQRAEVELAI